MKEEYAKHKKELNFLRGYQTYNKQHKSWRSSSFGKCLHARMQHFTKSSKWHHESMSQKRKSIEWIKNACKHVKDKHMMESFKKFRQGAQKTNQFSALKAKMHDTWNVINTGCMNKEMNTKAPTCKEYIANHFKRANIAGHNDERLRKN